MKAKSTKLKGLADGAKFKLSKRSDVVYKLDRKGNKKAWFTSDKSERTYCRPLSTIVFTYLGGRSITVRPTRK